MKRRLPRRSVVEGTVDAYEEEDGRRRRRRLLGSDNCTR